MTLALGLLAAAVLVGALGPSYLRATISPRVHPGVALSCWAVSVLVFVGCAVAAAVLLALPQHAAVDGIIGMTAACVNHGEHVWETVIRLGGIAVVAVGVGRLLYVVFGSQRDGAAQQAEHLSTVRVLAERDAAESSLWWLPAEQPVAYSLGGRHGGIVATTGVAGLANTARAAILAHERAHLRGGHHRLVLLADAVGRALPVVPLFRAAPPAVRVLVELAADATAARQCGRASVRAALRSAGSGLAPAESLAMSRDAVEVRLRWLPAMRGEARGGVRHRAQYAAAVVFAVAPAAATLAGIAGLIALLCLTVGA